MSKYSNEFKLKVIEFYQKENYGVKYVANYFNIPSSELVRRWIKNITAKGAISQKDNFHIHQEIVRDIPDKQYREELEKIIEEKRFDEVQKYIENLKSELGGEEKTVKKLKVLQIYLKEGLPRYQDILKERNEDIHIKGLEKKIKKIANFYLTQILI